MTTITTARVMRARSRRWRLSWVPGAAALATLGSIGSAAAQPPPPPLPLPTTDEFHAPAQLVPTPGDPTSGSLGIWTVANAHLIEQDPVSHDYRASIGLDGLTLIPWAPGAGPGGAPYGPVGWYSDNQGPFIYQTLSVNRDFIAVTHVTVSRRNDPTLAPRGWFNSAGFLLRYLDSPTAPDRWTTAGDAGRQSWVMFNIGYQHDGRYGFAPANVPPYAREAKYTRPPTDAEIAADPPPPPPAPGPPSPSRSAFYLDGVPTNPVAPPDVRALSVKLMLCRVGNAIRLFHAYADDGIHPAQTSWFEETTPWPGSLPADLAVWDPPMNSLVYPWMLEPVAGSSVGFVRFPMPPQPPPAPPPASPAPPSNQLQIGLIANNYGDSLSGQPAETRARFHYVRFFDAPQTADGCATAVPVPAD